MGWLCGVIFKAFGNKRTQGIVPYGVASLSGALLNTILFMGTLILLFGRTEYILSMRGEASVLMFIVGMVGVQGVLEALICCIIGAIVSKSCYNIYNKKAS